MKVAVLSPHRDDAAFSCGLMLNKLVQAQVTVTIVNVCTTSEYAPYLTEDGHERVLQVTAMRQAEDVAFVKLLTQSTGFDNVTLLDLAWRDLPLRWETEDENALAPLPLRQAEIDALSSAFAALPDQDLVLAPLALGGHIDHRLVRLAAQQVFGSSTLIFYEDLPYACRVKAAERTGVISKDGIGTSEAWLPEDGTGAGVKRAYAGCYSSQIAPDIADEMERYAEEHGGREHFFADAAAMRKLQTTLKSRRALA